MRYVYPVRYTILQEPLGHDFVSDRMLGVLVAFHQHVTIPATMQWFLLQLWTLHTCTVEKRSKQFMLVTHIVLAREGLRLAMKSSLTAKTIASELQSGMYVTGCAME